MLVAGVDPQASATQGLGLHPRLFLAPGHPDLARVDQLLTPHRVQRGLVLDEALRDEALRDLRDEYDFILIPIDAQYAPRGVGRLNQGRRICDKLSPHAVRLLGAVLSKLGVVLSKQVVSASLHASVRRETGLLFGGNVFEAVIPYRAEVGKSPGYRPVVFSGGVVAAPYAALATDLLRRLAGAMEPAAHAEAA